MAVTGDIFKSLTFDGESSRDYGVYITGQAVYNAPERDVEMVTIPGRNGAFALDKGRFENIEVTYPAGVFANTDTEFAKAISDFRNMLCSRQGYCRLTDEYNPDEYRLAVYKSGLEVDPVQLKAGQFDITFECKPQRYLTSGEEKKVLGTWGDTETKTGEIVELENDGSLAVKSAEVSLEPQQDTSGGVPSPSNPCPITGASDVDVNVSGKNLINISDVEIGTAWNGASNTARARLIVNLIKGQIYTLKMNGTSDLDSWYGTLTDTIPPSSAGGSLSNPWTFTATTKYLSLGFNKANITQADVEALKLQLEYGSTATDYVPYNTDSDTYTTSLGTTVYNGSVDVVAGTGQSTWGVKTFNDIASSIGYVSSGGYFYGAISDKALGNANFISSAYEIADVGSVNNLVNGQMKGHANNTNIYWKDSNYTSKADFLTAMGNEQICYELATPTTLTLTPTQVDLISGTNYVFSPQGEITLEYGTNPNFIVNPTLFGCGPLIEAKGYGDISFNGHTISLQDGTVGQVTLWGYTNKVIGAPLVTPFYSNITKTFQTNMFNSSDSFQFFVEVHLAITDSTAPSVTSSGTSTATANLSGGVVWVNIMAPITSLTVGSSDIVTASATLTWSSSKKLKIDMEVVYTDGFVDYRVTITRTGTITYSADSSQYIVLNQCTATSTLNLLGNPTYIDCDLGEAYKINDGKPVGLNSFVDLGSKLPELAPGINEFTVSNTFTEVAVVPRWWRI